MHGGWVELTVGLTALSTSGVLMISLSRSDRKGGHPEQGPGSSGPASGRKGGAFEVQGEGERA